MHTSTILIVDDEATIRKTLGELLAAQGYRVALASSGEEALAKLADLAPDLILLDVIMPGMDGFEVCRRLRADPVLAEVPIIMVTAMDDRDSRLQGIEAGADDFVGKPFDYAELRARVKTITRLNRYRRLLLERTQRQVAEEEVRRLNLDLALLNHVIMAAASTLDAKEVLRVGCDVLAHAFDMPRATAALLDKERMQFTIVAEYALVPRPPSKPVGDGRGQTPEPRGWLGRTVPVAEEPAAEYILEHKTPLVIGDEETDLRLEQTRLWMRKRSLVSMLVVPVLVRDQVVGTIELDAGDRREFSDRDLALAQSVATALGQAIQTAQLYQKLQRHALGLEETVAQRTFELQSERDRTQSILEALGEAVVVADMEGKLQYVNPAASALTGYTREEALGQSWRLPQSDSGIDELDQQVRDTMRAGQTWRGTVINRRKDGSAYDAVMTAAPLFDPHDVRRPIGFVSVQRDITPLKEAERLKDQFVSNVSHELRTPLSVITLVGGNLDTLYERLDDSKRRKMIRDIREYARVLDELVGSVLDISRIDSQRISMEREPLDLAELAREEVDKQMPLARKKSQTLLAIGDKDSFVLGNDGQLRQVIRNLLNNAIKYTPDGGRITCECLAQAGRELAESAWPGSAGLPAGRWAALRVADTGIAISPEDLPHVFERFYRVQSQGNIPGTGLGLSIAKELVELHGGHIAAASTPGEGSIFALYLPLLEEE
jgi:PAS domain S-box-containing protein